MFSLLNCQREALFLSNIVIYIFYRPAKSTDEVDNGPSPKKSKIDLDDLKNQNVILFEYRDKLSELSSAELTKLLRFNDQQPPTGKEEVRFFFFFSFCFINNFIINFLNILSRDVSYFFVITVIVIICVNLTLSLNFKFDLTMSNIFFRFSICWQMQWCLESCHLVNCAPVNMNFDRSYQFRI